MAQQQIETQTAQQKAQDFARIERALTAARLLAPHGVPSKVLAEALSGALDLPRRSVYQALLADK